MCDRVVVTRPRPQSIVLSSHVLFNTPVMNEDLMHNVLFRNIVLAAEDAVVRPRNSPPNLPTSSPAYHSQRNLNLEASTSAE